MDKLTDKSRDGDELLAAFRRALETKTGREKLITFFVDNFGISNNYTQREAHFTIHNRFQLIRTQLTSNYRSRIVKAAKLRSSELNLPVPAVSV